MNMSYARKSQIALAIVSGLPSVERTWMADKIRAIESPKDAAPLREKTAAYFQTLDQKQPNPGHWALYGIELLVTNENLSYSSSVIAAVAQKVGLKSEEVLRLFEQLKPQTTTVHVPRAASVAASAAAAAAKAIAAGKNGGTKPQKRLTLTPPDDLKQIRGIGIVMEKKLHDLGTTTIGQIASWTPGTVARMDAMLDLQGRISRENWIEQAKILAAGHSTHFSRRYNETLTAA